MVKPTESELRILQILWDKGPSSVRDVHETLNSDKEAGYTTTLKLMQIMTEKGLTNRDTSARTHIYKAIPNEEGTKASLLQTFVNATYGGSVSSLVLQALGGSNTTVEELNEIKALITQLEKPQ